MADFDVGQKKRKARLLNRRRHVASANDTRWAIWHYDDIGERAEPTKYRLPAGAA